VCVCVCLCVCVKTMQELKAVHTFIRTYIHIIMLVVFEV
jgi:hypothetical protein